MKAAATTDFTPADQRFKEKMAQFRAIFRKQIRPTGNNVLITPAPPGLLSRLKITRQPAIIARASRLKSVPFLRPVPFFTHSCGGKTLPPSLDGIK